MSKSIYETGYIKLIDNTEIEISPLKLKYFRKFMDVFDSAKDAKNDTDLIDNLVLCVQVCMKQFYPQLKTVDDILDNINLPTIYDILYFSANIKMGHWAEDETVNQKQSNLLDNDKSSWESLDLNKLESEVFLIGAWKNYDELELSISMAELLITLEAKRDLDYQEKKFLAAMQGIDLDEGKPQEQDPWEAMKARVASAGSTSDPNDITSFQGIRAAQAGFGIGMGLDYATDI